MWYHWVFRLKHYQLVGNQGAISELLVIIKIQSNRLNIRNLSTAQLYYSSCSIQQSKQVVFSCPITYGHKNQKWLAIMSRLWARFLGSLANVLIKQQLFFVEPRPRVQIWTADYPDNCPSLSKHLLQGISLQSEQSNLALLRIQILIFADSSTCS